MALGPESSSSATASTTSSSASPTDTSSGSQSNNNSGGFFSAGGSPPLILAFLAIGLFTAAMIAVFGYRRVHFGRAWLMDDPTMGGTHGPGVRRKKHDYGEKPVLWDLWSPKGLTGVEGGWEGFMPISAAIIVDTPFVLPASDETEIPGPTTMDRIYDPNLPAATIPGGGRGGHRRSGSRLPSTTPLNLTRRFQHLSRVRDIFQRTPPSSSDTAANSSNPSTGGKGGDRDSISSEIPETRLRVAVSIALPTPRRPVFLKDQEVKCDDPEEEDLLEYSLGLLEIPWHLPQEEEEAS